MHAVTIETIFVRLRAQLHCDDVVVFTTFARVKLLLVRHIYRFKVQDG